MSKSSVGAKSDCADIHQAYQPVVDLMTFISEMDCRCHLSIFEGIELCFVCKARLVMAALVKEVSA